MSAGEQRRREEMDVLRDEFKIWLDVMSGDRKQERDRWMEEWKS